MRKSMLRSSLLLILLAATYACTKEKDDNGDESDSSELFFTGDLPKQDMLSEKDRLHTVYSFSSANLATTELSLADNFLKRYSFHEVWSSAKKPKIGDIFFFQVSDISVIISDPIIGKAVQAMYDQGVCFAMNGGKETDFERIATFLHHYNPYTGMIDDNYYDGEQPLWIFAGALPSAASYNTRLCPTNHTIINDAHATTGEVKAEVENDNVAAYSDYVQGQIADNLVANLGDMLQTNTSKSLVNRADDEKELSRLITAHRISVPSSCTLKWSQFDHPGKGVSTDDRVNYYQLELFVWNAFSESEKRNYYFIQQKLLCGFQNTFLGEWHDAVWASRKTYGYMGDKAIISLNPVDPSGVTLHTSKPQTTQQTSQYTSGMSWSLGGEVSLPKQISVSGGVTFSQSATYNIEDLTVDNNSQVGVSPVAAWEYRLRGASSHFHLFYYAFASIDPGSRTGITSMEVGADCIFSVPQGHSTQWKVKSLVRIQRIGCNASSTDARNNADATVEQPFNMPIVK